MSLSRSTGGLVPQDIAEILARERHAIKARKHRGGSLGRAFRWLKARRRKKGGSLGSGRANGLAAAAAGDAKHGHQHGHDVGKGLSKQEEESRPCLSPLYPENVFIEGDPPQFIQDLHSEAQEGLKILLQEENGMDFQDDESIVSTATLQTGDESSLTDSMRMVGSGDTATDAMSTVSAASAVSNVSAVSMVSDVSAASTLSTRSTRSTRSGLSRQGSTFKPISGGRKPEKRRRSKRATVAGIPQHVKKELGLDRGPWPPSPTEGQLPNGEGGVAHGDEADALPDPGATPEGVRVHLEALEVLETAEEQQLLRRHLQALYRDDLASARNAGPRLSPGRRAKSVAVPGAATAAPLLAPPAPAPASGSPSEAYPPSPVMYISPQATYLSKIIPNAVLPGEVDVIEISRKGRSRGSVRTLSKGSLSMPSPALSRASWSGSDSSHTVVSDSSTISSGGGRRRQAKREAQRQAPAPTSPDRVSLHSSISCTSNITSVSQQSANHQPADGPFGRSMSVKKLNKNPPAPPRRTNSLHPNKLRRRSRDLLDAPVLSSSLAYSADQSQVSSSSSSSSTVASPPAPVQHALQTLSPSSGYSSQGATPTYAPAQQGAPSKASSLLATVLGLGPLPDIPPHPKVKAPTPPPPETWIHDQRSFDLLCGPVSVQRNLFVALQKVRLDRQRQQAQRPPVAGGEVSPAGQKKAPPPVKKKSLKMEVLRHAGAAAVMKLTPPSSLPPCHYPPPPTTETDSAWPLPPPPPVEMLPGSVFDGQDDFLPPPPLQDGAGSPPVPACAEPAPPTLVTMETVPPVSRTQQLSQGGTPPLKDLPLPYGVPPPPNQPPPLPPEAPPALQLVLSPPQGIPPPPQKAPPPPTAAATLLQQVLPPPQAAPPAPIEATPPPQESPSIATEAPPPPQETPPVIIEAPPPPQETPPVTIEAPPPPQETPPVIIEAPPPPQETPPVTIEAPPPPQETPPVIIEAPPPPQETPPVIIEAPSPPQETPPVIIEAPPPPQETPPVIIEAPPLPQEIPPVTIEAPPPPQEAPPVTIEAPPPPQETPPVIIEAPPPPQETPPVTIEAPPPPQETPPVTIEAPPPPQETPPVTIEAPPPPQETPPLTIEVLSPPQEAPPVPQEVLSPPQEAPPVPQEVLLPPQEAPPVPQEVLRPPQEASPVPQEVLPPPQEASPAPEEVRTFAAVSTSPLPQPVEEQAPPTCPAEPGPANQEPRIREPQPKGSPTAKREARVPMTTSALLQMVRMRASEAAGEKPGQNQNQALGQSAAGRPKTPPPAVKYPPPSTGPAPSMKLQEAIRMKTAAMSRLGSRSPRSASPSPSPSPSPSSPSAASTASFIFAKSPRKVVIETPSSPRLQAGLKANLAAELSRIAGPAKTASAQKKPAKVPPPVARKPSQHHPSDQDQPTDLAAPTCPADATQQKRDGLTENGGEMAPANEAPTERAQPKEGPQSLNANPGGAQSACTAQASLSPPP